MNGVYNVNRVKITWEAAYASAYQVQISGDGNTWNTIRTVTGNTTLVNDWTGLSGAGRYLRINGTARATAWGYSIFELEVYGTPQGVREATTSESVGEEELTLYPNPVDDALFVKVPADMKDGVVNIADATGRSFAFEKIENDAYHVGGLPTGFYIFRVSKGHQQLSKKFIKK